MRWTVAALVLVTGCAIGAGPIVGYSARRGAFYGAEAGAGLVIAQAAIAAHSTGEIYLRGEVIADVAGALNGKPVFAPGYRIGGGYAVSGRTGGVFVAGANINFLLTSHGGTFGGLQPAALIAIDARYVGGEWAIVLAPRIEGHGSIDLFR